MKLFKKVVNNSPEAKLLRAINQADLDGKIMWTCNGTGYDGRWGGRVKGEPVAKLHVGLTKQGVTMLTVDQSPERIVYSGYEYPNLGQLRKRISARKLRAGAAAILKAHS